MAADPRAAGAIEADDADSAPAEAAGPPASDRPMPALHSTEQPKYVDPAVAARKREEARTRAAEQAAREAAQRSKRNLIVAGCVLLAVLAVVAWMSLR